MADQTTRPSRHVEVLLGALLLIIVTAFVLGMFARVVLGKVYPNQCVLYGRACTPRHPIGPCMVSDEGACRIWWSSGVREPERAANAA